MTPTFSEEDVRQMVERGDISKAEGENILAAAQRQEMRKRVRIRRKILKNPILIAVIVALIIAVILAFFLVIAKMKQIPDPTTKANLKEPLVLAVTAPYSPRSASDFS